ncbi:hypothetical protein CEXT_789491 [Caerostris extrusa]|uniref:Uncharacterized protein n=1 Tax=Caerostris extrusa TaxID=172846 RepID=A0AAV4XQ52_CAEEX|nr:hypothetical protein CEXT_789491 [Caerostris extrusa]
MQQPIIDKEYKKGLFLLDLLKSIYFPFGQDDMKRQRCSVSKSEEDFKNGACLLKKAYVSFWSVWRAIVQKAVWGRSGQGLLSLLSSPLEY